MAQVDPIWKFCQLLDRLVRNDKRIIDCLTAIARDYQGLGAHLVEKIEYKLFSTVEPFRKLLYLYVIDSISFNVPIIRDYLSHRVANIFTHCFKLADTFIKKDIEKLLIVWETQGRFPLRVLEEMREKMAPTPPSISSPINSPDGPGLFDLGELGDWLSQNSYCPQELLIQGIEDSSPLLYSCLLASERSKAELEKLSMKLSIVDPRDIHRYLITELYDELPKQCLICGLRFGLDSELDLHLDWHFAEGAKKQPLKPWLPAPITWIDPRLHIGLLDEEAPKEVVEVEHPWAPCNPDQLSCPLCGELFEIIPKETAWFCKDASKVFVSDQNKEVILHTQCINSISHSQTINQPIEFYEFEDGFF